MDEANRTPVQMPMTEEDIREMVLRLAHEIRNPLATIKSGIQLVQHLTQPEGEIAEYLDTALLEVRRIDRCVRDMQRFVRIGAGSSSVLQIDRAAAEAVEQVAKSAAERGVSLQVAAGEPLRVFMDQDQLRTALVELMTNAVRFTPEGSQVALSWDRSEGERVLIHVDDEGNGISRDIQERILKPFYSTSTYGTGLGLNIVDRICRLAGGHLEWRNLAGKGARFTLSLPGV